MRILLSNDDGIHAHGLAVLEKELKKLGTVYVVAPLEEKSTTGHSLTIHKPLRLLEFGKRRFACTGSPADCVYLGVREVIGGMPDLVVSGINRGANLGQDVYYSGTVSAAREACILGLQAIAVSLAIDFSSRKRESAHHYETAARVTVQTIQRLRREKIQAPLHTLFNLNVPDVTLSRLKGTRAGRQGFRHYDGGVLKRSDHRGRDYFWVGGKYTGFKREHATDCAWVDQGYASLTPVKLDTTDLTQLARLRAIYGGGE